MFTTYSDEITKALLNLKTLYDSGVVDDAEFSDVKKALLAQLASVPTPQQVCVTCQ